MQQRQGVSEVCAREGAREKEQSYFTQAQVTSVTVMMLPKAEIETHSQTN